MCVGGLPACAVGVLGVVPSVRPVMSEVASVGALASTLVTPCRCCVLASCVHPAATLRAVFCTICSLSRMH